MTTSARFQSDAQKYADYLETPEGRLRIDLALANLEDNLPPAQAPLSALDIGGGTGKAAVRLARLGMQVTLIDSSTAMLALAQRAAQEEEISGKVRFQHGDAADLVALFPECSFDLVLLHNVLEYVENPAPVLHKAARVLRDGSSILSILVRNQAGEVFKAAILSGDLVAAEECMTAECTQESLYGGEVRLFSPERLRAMLKEASLAPLAERGVRVLSDYLPPEISRSGDYHRIFRLERKLGSRPEFAGVARYIQVLARLESSGNRT